jgi:hypothetical protein
VRALQRALELLFTSNQECGDRQPLEIRGAQGRFAIGPRQERVSIFPRAVGVRSPAAIQVFARHALSMTRRSRGDPGPFFATLPVAETTREERDE